MTKRQILSIIIIFISMIAFGQDFQKEKSENHIEIKGTKIFMIPPVSFELSTNYKGFQNPNDPMAMIMTMDIPGPFLEVSKGFNSETLKTKGMELKNKKTIKIANYDGLLIDLDQPANGMIFSKHILVYGDSNFTTLINGVYLKDSLQLGEKIKASILTTVVDINLESNPREALDYTIDENAGNLQYHSVVGNGFLFRRDLGTPTDSSDKVTLITDKSFAKVDIKDKKLFCASRLKKYPDDYSINVQKGINEVEIDNLKGYELFATNNDKKDEEMYQVILFDENGGYFLFVGTYLSGNENAVIDIKNIIKTFKRKK